MTAQTQPDALRLANRLDADATDADMGRKAVTNTRRKAAAELHRLHAKIQQLKEEQRLCMQEVSSLATYIFRKHYSHEPHYASGEVVWGLCGSTRGVISQIDNMIAGLTRKCG